MVKFFAYQWNVSKVGITYDRTVAIFFMFTGLCISALIAG